MTPIISYKNFIKYSRDKKEARESLKRWILGRRMTVLMAAQSLKCSKNTIVKLLHDKNLDYEAKKAPLTCPHKLPLEIEMAIVNYHIKHGFGPDMIKLNCNVKHSTSTIYRVLNDHNLTGKRIRKWKRKQYTSKYKKKLKAFEQWQLDTKYLIDIPNLVGPIYQGLVPKYEYTLRDMRTGTTFLGFGLKERSVKDSCSFIALCLYHMQLHGVDTHYVTIQSDNGPEILGKFNQIKDYEIRKVIEDKFNAKFRTIPIRRPTFNSHVESFHGRVEYEAYDRFQIKYLSSFSKKMMDYMSYWNMERKSLKFRKTPEKIAKEYGFDLPKCFYNFPILFYDTITSQETNPISSQGHYLPDDVMLPRQTITSLVLNLYHC